jgi:hypothetical protein
MGCRGSRGSRRQVEFLAINLTKRKEVGVQESKRITLYRLDSFQKALALPNVA